MDIQDNLIPEEENLNPQETDFTPEQPAQEEPQAVAPACEPQPVQSAYEPQPEQPAQKRKVSPYEDSPYVINRTYQTYQKAYEPPKPKKKKTGFWKKALCAILILALVTGACVTTAQIVNDRWEDRMEQMADSFEDQLEDLQDQINDAGSNSGMSVSGSPVASGDGLTPAQVYAMNVKSVVMIYNVVTTTQYGQTATGTSTGSGFILSEEGYVVTNYHVVEGDGELSVVTSDNQEYAATLVGYDATNDVALLKVQAQGLQPVILGKSSDLIVGDQVAAIGNPLGELTSTLTVGYISAMERDVNTDGFAINMLQTDAAINSGNSGGPLFNMKGEVIGITTAKYSGTSSSGASIEGVGFAIPIDDVSGLLSDLATYGYVTGAYLGISVSDVEAASAAYYGMPLGAYVQAVEAGYAAQRAGIQSKDIIVELGGIEVENVNDLTRALRNFEAGQTTTITVYRRGQELKLSVTLDEKPVDTQPQIQEIPSDSEDMPEGDFNEWFDYLKPYFGFGEGND